MDGTLPSLNSLSKGTHHTGESTIRKGFPTAAESLDPRTITQILTIPHSGGSINGHYLRPLGKSLVCHWDCLRNYIPDCP